MAKLIVTTSAPDFLFWPDAFANDGPADILSTSATVLKFTSNAGYVITLAGAGFIVAGGAATAGTVTSVMVRDAGDSVVFMTIDGLATPLADLYPQLFGSGAGDPLAALELLLKGKDSLVGSSDRDQLGGYSPGNDTVQTYRGNDAVVGDRGNDQLDGGGDFDILSYYLDEGALHGIRLDAEKGVVIDPWGGKDRIENFEILSGNALRRCDEGKHRQADILRRRWRRHDRWSRRLRPGDLCLRGERGRGEGHLCRFRRWQGQGQFRQDRQDQEHRGHRRHCGE